jgi:hypothetical protein
VFPANGNSKVAKRAPATPVTFTAYDLDEGGQEEVKFPVILNNIWKGYFHCYE